MGNATCIRIRANFPGIRGTLRQRRKTRHLVSDSIHTDPLPPQRISITRYDCAYGLLSGNSWSQNTRRFVLTMLVIATRIDRSKSRDVINHARLSSEIRVRRRECNIWTRSPIEPRCQSQRTTPGLNPTRNCRGYQRVWPVSRSTDPPPVDPALTSPYVDHRDVGRDGWRVLLFIAARV